MSAEFASLDDKANRIAWAAGCASTAFAWRLQASAVYLIALVALPALWNVILVTVIFSISTMYAFSQPLGQQDMGHLWMAISGATTQSTLFAMSAALCAYRPRYAIVSVVVLWLATTGAAFIAMFGPAFAPLLVNAPFSAENNHPAVPNVVMALSFFGADMWPVVLGGLAGWAFARGKGGAMIAAGVLAFALVIGFASFFSNPGDFHPVYAFLGMTAVPIICAALLLAIVISLGTAARDVRRAWRAAG